MTERPRTQVCGITISTPDPRALAEFYSRLTGWPILMDEPGWVVIGRSSRPEDDPGIAFHIEDNYVRPVWPTRPGEQLSMMHLDVGAVDLAAVEAYAVECGATFAEHQPGDGVRVYLDPDGHPFCLFQWAGATISSPSLAV